mgnify:CR=1 FL=1
MTSTAPPITSIRPKSLKRKKLKTTSGRIMVERDSPKPNRAPDASVARLLAKVLHRGEATARVVDVALRYVEGDWPDVSAEKIMALSAVPVAAPACRDLHDHRAQFKYVIGNRGEGLECDQRQDQTDDAGDHSGLQRVSAGGG